MNKYLYVDSEGRVCRIEADTGAMIPVEWNQPDVDAARKRYEIAKAEMGKLYPQSIPFGVKSSVPIFEVVIGNPANPKHVYRIWANGRTEGFGEDAFIKNRIPVALCEARNESRGVPLVGIAPVAA